MLDAMLNAHGICRVPDIYDAAQIAQINAAVDPILKERADQRRAYVHVDELHDLGVLDVVLGERMRNVLLSVMPDPVLYHCFVIETAANDPESNIFNETLAGWHSDDDCSYSPQEPTHVSAFVYLTDVGPDDGGFEFVPQKPENWLRSSTEKINVRGSAGCSFVWQRAYFHRASPNRGPRRRRVVKLSFQRNAFPSFHLGNERYRRTIGALPVGNPVTDVLFGRYQGRSAPTISRPDVPASVIETTGHLDLTDSLLAKAQLRRKASAAKQRLRELIGGARLPQAVVYD